MNYKYSVKGVVEKSFILRGLFFRIGSSIDLCITEKELDFVVPRCNNLKVTDLEKATETPKPIQNTTQIKTQNTQKVVKDELQQKQGIRTSKG